MSHLGLLTRIWILGCACFPLACTGDEASKAAESLETAPALSPQDPTEGMVRIAKGPFIFGATEEQFQVYLAGLRVRIPGIRERLRKVFIIPPREIILPAFYMDEFEVTNEQYHKFVEAAGYQPEEQTDYLAHWKDSTSFPEWSRTFPVNWVSQLDARVYCRWAGKRLPTEQEWEKAARGENGAAFPWGNASFTIERANVRSERLEPAGNRPLDVSPYGVYDLAGNLAEWTNDTQVRADGTVGAVAKGGSFNTQFHESLAYARTVGLAPTQRVEHIGFRCAADAPAAELEEPSGRE